MTVERRLSKRYPLTGDVYIRYRKQRAFSAEAENCSVDGMYLKTKSLTLLTGAFVELDILRNGRNWSIVGIVTHCQKNGLGIMFLTPQAEFYASVLADTKMAATASVIPRSLLPTDRTPGEVIP